MMAALHTAPDSPDTQLEPAEDGSECDAEPEEEEEEEEEDDEQGREEEEVVVEEEVATQVQEAAGVEVEANSADTGGGDDGDDGDVEEVLAEEQTLSLGTQKRLSNGADAKSPALQGKGKDGTLPLPGRRRGWGREGGPGSEVWEDPGAPPCLPARYHWL